MEVLGGDGSNGSTGGNAYGDVYTASLLGSGGGNNGSVIGGAGGGAIKIVANELILDGIIDSSGEDGRKEMDVSSGGGSGGSIWIIADSFVGSGWINSIGASGGDWKIGDGAGGRVVIDVPVEGNTFGDESIDAYSTDDAGTGTIYLTEQDQLIVQWGAGFSAPAVLLPGDYDFDIIKIADANLRILGEDSTLKIDSDTVMLGDRPRYEYGLNKLEMEGTFLTPSELVIKGFMLVPLHGLGENVQNILIIDDGGLELHAEASPEPRGVYSFESITVGDENSNNNTLRLVPFDNENEDYSDDYGVTLGVNNLTVNSDGVIEADGQGYRGGMGPGKGNNAIGTTSFAGGAGHGGEGGSTDASDLGYTDADHSGGDGYGSVYTPTMLGSGGGYGISYSDGTSEAGGAGGGAFKLEVTNSMLVNGYISANAEKSPNYGGGGSGGSIWIVANSLDGDGNIEAMGAYGGTSYLQQELLQYSYHSGSGAGGRIAIDVPSEQNTFLGTTDLRGGYRQQASIQTCAASGTLYWTKEDKLSVSGGCSNGPSTVLEEHNYDFDVVELNNNAVATILGENSSLAVNNTAFIGDGTGRLAVEGKIIAPAGLDFTFSGHLMLAVLNEFVGPENITLENGGGLEFCAQAKPDGSFNFGNITVANGGRLRLSSFNDGDTDFTDDYGTTLHVENLRVDVGGVIEANGQGYSASSGLGKGADATGETNEQAGGGGYGGAGGTGAGSNLGGAVYGDLYTPMLLGSGGGNITGGARGGAGGGAFKLEVENVLTLNGIVWPTVKIASHITITTSMEPAVQAPVAVFGSSRLQ